MSSDYTRAVIKKAIEMLQDWFDAINMSPHTVVGTLLIGHLLLRFVDF